MVREVRKREGGGGGRGEEEREAGRERISHQSHRHSCPSVCAVLSSSPPASPAPREAAASQTA